MAFGAIFSQIKLLFGPLVIQLVWYNTKTIIILLSVGEGGVYLPRCFAARQVSTTIHLHLGE